MRADGRALQLDLLLDAAGGLDELQVDLVAQVRAAVPGLARAAEAEEVAEDVAERAEDVLRRGVVAEVRPLEAGHPVAVVELALLGVAEHLVGLGALLEERLGLLVARVAVGVVLHGLGPVGLLDLGAVGLAGDAEHLVEILLGCLAVTASSPPAGHPAATPLPRSTGRGRRATAGAIPQCCVRARILGARGCACQSGVNVRAARAQRRQPRRPRAVVTSGIARTLASP